MRLFVPTASKYIFGMIQSLFFLLCSSGCLVWTSVSAQRQCDDRLQ